ncbi:MAG TPA: secretion protein HlyD [Candidatus Limnocylindrales bacterium]|nr:secretion protein HlyD [Candidatus Limnocylindrales bacterium]
MKRRIPVVLAVVVVAGFVVWFIYTKQAESKSRTLQLFGNVDIREVNLGFRVSGRLTQVLRDEGDEVRPGQVLARLDDEPYRREVDESRAQVAALRAHLDLLEAGNRPQEIAQARALVREREATAANAERLFKRQDELLGTKAVSIQQRDDSEAGYREAEARLKSASEQLNLLEAGFRIEDIAQAKADIARAQATLANAELRVEDTILKAPSDGYVLTRAQEPGAILPAGTTVLTVSLKRPVWVRAYVSEPDLGRIHPGMKVTVHTDSTPAKPYTGQIGYISPRAEFTPKNVETTQLRTSLVYRFRVVVDNPDEALRQGMPVTIKAGD